MHEPLKTVMQRVIAGYQRLLIDEIGDLPITNKPICSSR